MGQKTCAWWCTNASTARGVWARFSMKRTNSHSAVQPGAKPADVKARQRIRRSGRLPRKRAFGGANPHSCNPLASRNRPAVREAPEPIATPLTKTSQGQVHGRNLVRVFCRAIAIDDLQRACLALHSLLG